MIDSSRSSSVQSAAVRQWVAAKTQRLAPLAFLRRVLAIFRQGVPYEQVRLLWQLFPQQQMPEEPGERVLSPGRR